ncbi:hypothetical protein [Cerasicoccus fimbriatus]|uniref:hypothetical protein n=1 Tax=Cerasicoccus fimbriatus TaxID=3014554 RepID=UPI0022B5AFA9|nr:hypothetical protein [Cerasicoccus sp. TK19100]
MSLIVLLIFSLATLTQVEMATAVQHRAEQKARENARLGLLVALGNLQAAAGPDQRVTARAEILGDGNYANGKQFWTGVWDTTNPTSEPVWLISGNTQITDAAVGKQLVKPTTSPIDGEIFPGIRAPMVEIFSDDGHHVGDYAYWVSGENDKLPMASLERANNFPSNEIERRYLEYQNFIPDLNYLSEDGYNNAATDKFNLDDNDTMRQHLAIAISNDQFSAIMQTNGNPAFPNWQQDSFSHDATANSWTVLANSKDGGLKHNLLDETSTELLANDATRNFFVGYDSPLIATKKDETNGYQNGAPYFAPRAIPTEIVLWMGIFHTWSDAKIRIRYHLQVEFWNPYTLPLVYDADTHYNHDRPFVVYFENLPEITVRQATGTLVAPVIKEDLNDLSAYSDDDYSERYSINSWVDVAPISQPHVPELMAGEVYMATEPNPATQARGLARDFGTQRWSENADTRPDDSDKIEIKAVHPENGVNIIIKTYANNPEDRETIFTIKNLKFDDFTIRKTFRNTSGNSADSFSRSSSSSYLQSDYTIAYHYRLDSDESDPGILEELINGLDMNDPVLDASETFYSSDGTEYKVSDFIVPASTDPADAAQLNLNTFSLLDIHRDNTNRSHLNSEPVLFSDIPRRDSDFVSLGAIRHLPIWEESSSLLGSPHPEAKNAVYDNYFVAGAGESEVDEPEPDANPYLTYLKPRETITPADVAENAYVHSGFNINSTSVPAWMAFLSNRGVIENDEGNDIPVRHLFTRLPFYSAENPIIETDENALALGQTSFPPYFRQGMRVVDIADAKNELLAVANGIVDHLKERGRPYYSIEDFLNSGVIEDELEDSSLNANILKDSNVYVTQGDVVAQRADVLTARSDTFLIRAYGSARDTLNDNVTSEAWIEAVARRRPIIGGATDSTINATETNPRRFEIVSWRWLDTAEVQ